MLGKSSSPKQSFMSKTTGMLSVNCTLPGTDAKLVSQSQTAETHVFKQVCLRVKAVVTPVMCMIKLCKQAVRHCFRTLSIPLS